jgi:transposase
MPRDDAETRAKRRKAIRQRHEAGMSNRAIARALGLDHKTVAFYLGEKLGDKTPPVAGGKTPPLSPPVDCAENIVQLRRKAQ